MSDWTERAFFYHLFPLGTFGAPWTNPGGDPVPRIRQLADWVAPAVRVGANALLLGPLWESGTHGYDTHNYTTLDRRLGANEDLKRALAPWRQAGFHVVLDGVFHHVGRDFAPFQDLRNRGRESPYASWFSGVDFGGRSPYGDPFSYHGWNGHLSLVKLNLAHGEVRAHLFAAVACWIDEFDIDGLRLDAADVMDKAFLADLAAFCRTKKPDFWLMAEVIHGDYRQWAPGASLDSVTNYQLYKGLWSSHNDSNYFEVAWTLQQQFGADGPGTGNRLFTFGDNHDVERIGSVLHQRGHLVPHAVLTALVPGIPAIYYGSEVGLSGTKAQGDEALRPALTPEDLDASPDQPLRALWGRLAALRQQWPSLRQGGYRQAAVFHKQFAFWREAAGQTPVLVAVNSDAKAQLTVDGLQGRWRDILGDGETFEAHGRLVVDLPECGARVLVPA